MGEAAMNLTPEQLTTIGEYVRGHIHEWIGPQSDTSLSERDLDQRERVIRVEESLKLGFEQSDNRFNDLIHQMDKRFEQVDKRFEQVDKRFEQVDKRFEQVDKRFSQMFSYYTTGIILLTVMMSVYKFLV